MSCRTFLSLRKKNLRAIKGNQKQADAVRNKQTENLNFAFINQNNCHMGKRYGKHGNKPDVVSKTGAKWQLRS